MNNKETCLRVLLGAIGKIRLLDAALAAARSEGHAAGLEEEARTALQGSAKRIRAMAASALRAKVES